MDHAQKVILCFLPELSGDLWAEGMPQGQGGWENSTYLAVSIGLRRLR
jgi:hypothetical protein